MSELRELVLLTTGRAHERGTETTATADRTRTKLRFCLRLGTVLLATACGSQSDVTGPEVAIPWALQQVEVTPFTINGLPEENLWFTGRPLQQLDFPRDADGVPLFEYDGRWHYHPVKIIQQGLYNLDSYDQSGDRVYLEQTMSYVDRLVKEAVTLDSALYFPYTFDFALHGLGDSVLSARWYSGMAQGEMLALLTRLYKLTSDERYLEIADRTFRSFLRVKGEADVYTVSIDSAGYYWIDEYPDDPPTQVLNGFIFAVYGLFEYYHLAESRAARGEHLEITPAVARHVLLASLTTLRHYVDGFRVPGGVSYYCLRHKVRSISYHRIHTRQLEDLFRMTGDTFFHELAELFYQDAH